MVKEFKKMKEIITERKPLICAVFFLGFSSCIFAPFELYALNTHDLWFSLKDFWYIPLLCGAFAIIAAVILGLLLRGKLLKAYTGIIFGAGLCVYIQGNFLNLNAGRIMGDAVDWSQYSGRMAGNLLLWILMICLITALSVRGGGQAFGRVITGVSLFLTAVLAVTLVVLLVPCIDESAKYPEYGYATDKDLLSLSDSNVLVFVLDKYDINYFRQALEEVPEFEEQLDGFTWFDNYAGCYSYTNLAVPFMLSGNYCRQADPYTQISIDAENRVYWDELIENGYEMSLYTPSELVPPRAGENAINFVNADNVISDHKAFTVLLYRLVMCKYFPDIVKPAVWLQPYEFEARRHLDSAYRLYAAENIVLADYLDQQEMTSGAEHPQFKFIHVSGAHPPFSIDEWGCRTEEADKVEEGAVKGSLRLVLRYMDEMKKLGIYDHSAIIITADHGDFAVDFSSPVFLVKPCGAHGSLEVSHTPASQADLGATILDLAGLRENLDAYGVSVFDESGERAKKRYYYTDTESSVTDINGERLHILTEYEVAPGDISADNFLPTGVTYGAEEENGN